MGRREADVASGRADAAGPEPGHVCGSVQNATAAGMLVRSALEAGWGWGWPAGAPDGKGRTREWRRIAAG